MHEPGLFSTMLQLLPLLVAAAAPYLLFSRWMHRKTETIFHTLVDRFGLTATGDEEHTVSDTGDPPTEGDGSPAAMPRMSEPTATTTTGAEAPAEANYDSASSATPGRLEPDRPAPLFRAEGGYRGRKTSIVFGYTRKPSCFPVTRLSVHLARHLDFEARLTGRSFFEDPGGGCAFSFGISSLDNRLLVRSSNAEKFRTTFGRAAGIATLENALEHGLERGELLVRHSSLSLSLPAHPTSAREAADLALMLEILHELASMADGDPAEGK